MFWLRLRFMSLPFPQISFFLLLRITCRAVVLQSEQHQITWKACYNTTCNPPLSFWFIDWAWGPNIYISTYSQVLLLSGDHTLRSLEDSGGTVGHKFCFCLSEKCLNLTFLFKGNLEGYINLGWQYFFFLSQHWKILFHIHRYCWKA